VRAVVGRVHDESVFGDAELVYWHLDWGGNRYSRRRNRRRRDLYRH
jgi:hypothetical protein